jgi:biopolymer transport protein ExbD
MGYENEGRSGSPFAVLAAVVVVVLVVGALILFGVGALVFVRTSVVRSEQILRDQQKAVAEAARQQQEYEQQAERELDALSDVAEAPPAKTHEIALRLDREGGLWSEERELTLAQLDDQLRKLQGDGVIRVRLTVDPGCRFEHVVPVQDLCAARNIQDLQLLTP